MLALLAMILPAAVVLITLFGVLAFGTPKPGGVTLFWRVGLVGLALGLGVWFLVARSGLLPPLPAMVHQATWGLVIGSTLIVVIAAIGTALKRKQR
jgi:hypothetical protein